MKRALAAVLAVATLTACGGEGDGGDPQAAPSASATTAALEADYLAYLADTASDVTGVPESDLLAAGHLYCDWVREGGSSETATRDNAVGFPDYFSEREAGAVRFAAPRSLCPELLHQDGR